MTTSFHKKNVYKYEKHANELINCTERQTDTKNFLIANSIDCYCYYCSIYNILAVHDVVAASKNRSKKPHLIYLYLTNDCLLLTLQTISTPPPAHHA